VRRELVDRLDDRARDLLLGDQLLAAALLRPEVGSELELRDLSEALVLVVVVKAPP
jgi:hypothetical protein